MKKGKRGWAEESLLETQEFRADNKKTQQKMHGNKREAARRELAESGGQLSMAHCRDGRDCSTGPLMRDEEHKDQNNRGRLQFRCSICGTFGTRSDTTQAVVEIP